MLSCATKATKPPPSKQRGGALLHGTSAMGTIDTCVTVHSHDLCDYVGCHSGAHSKRRHLARATDAVAVIHAAARLWQARRTLARTRAEVSDMRAALLGALRIIDLGEQEAARSIQRVVRGGLARVSLNLRHYCASLVQARMRETWRRRALAARQLAGAIAAQRLVRGFLARAWRCRWRAAACVQRAWRGHAARAALRWRRQLVLAAEVARQAREDAAVDRAGQVVAAEGGALAAAAGVGPSPGSSWAAAGKWLAADGSMRHRVSKFMGSLHMRRGRSVATPPSAPAAGGGAAAPTVPQTELDGSRARVASMAIALRSQLRSAVVGVLARRGACGADLASAVFRTVDVLGWGVLDGLLVAAVLTTLQVPQPPTATQLLQFMRSYHAQRQAEVQGRARVASLQRRGKWLRLREERGVPAWLGRHAVLDEQGVLQLLTALEGEGTWLHTPLQPPTEDAGAAQVSGPQASTNAGTSHSTGGAGIEDGGAPLVDKHVTWAAADASHGAHADADVAAHTHTFSPSRRLDPLTLLRKAQAGRFRGVLKDQLPVSVAWQLALRATAWQGVAQARVEARERFRSSGPPLVPRKVVAMAFRSQAEHGGDGSGNGDNQGGGSCDSGNQGDVCTAPVVACESCGEGFVFRTAHARHRIHDLCSGRWQWKWQGVPDNMFPQLHPDPRPDMSALPRTPHQTRRRSQRSAAGSRGGSASSGGDSDTDIGRRSSGTFDSDGSSVFTSEGDTSGTDWTGTDTDD